MTNIYSYIHELHFFRILNSKSWINQIGERSESVIIKVCTGSIRGEFSIPADRHQQLNHFIWF